MTMAFYHDFMLIGYGSAGITAVLIVVLKFCWRRGKPLQEP
jgi:hypothetical protein